ncbi:uncharacterized protein BJ171DRAFT_590032 [Polychytrium aggregatum]|uniref:uncharacterized protein n=1 Tax=Polychytrium aggregatum TaxID=110093 RepID=UPI0022FE62FA|nr:uncharacterized protein BJ171DRAFT_590032 [Polychytrium aggregatum]KAI9192947.1 hypothetical protein BJ171DRAFT_590032 [Polychytrium aggregatum]
MRIPITSLEIDARIIELNNELRNTGPVSFGTQAFNSRPPSFQPPAQEPPVLYSEPMQIDAAVVSRLTPEEKNRRFQERLCFRCGKPGHVAKSCPLKSGSRAPASGSRFPGSRPQAPGSRPRSKAVRTIVYDDGEEEHFESGNDQAQAQI